MAGRRRSCCGALGLLLTACTMREPSCESLPPGTCEKDDDCGELAQCIPYGGASFCNARCVPNVDGQERCREGLQCCGEGWHRFCGDRFECAGLLPCNAERSSPEAPAGTCPRPGWECNAEVEPPSCGPAEWGEPQQGPACASHADCIDRGAYCSAVDGCRSLYDVQGSYCPRAELAFARNAEGPILFGAEQPRLDSGLGCVPCGEGLVQCRIDVRYFDAEGDYSGLLRSLEEDGTHAPFGFDAELAYGKLVLRPCLPPVAGVLELGLVAIDDAGHRSNPLCVRVHAY